jgi:hypothetical protein
MIIFRKERLEAELAALRDEWRVQMERSLKSLADETIARLTRDSGNMETEVATRIAGMGQALTEATVQTENKLSTLREELNHEDERSRQGLSQLEDAERRINDETAKLAQASGEIDLKLSGLRQYLDEQNDRLHESLRQLQAADERLSQQLSKLDAVAHAAGQNLESRAAAVLDGTSQEMTRRVEERVAAWGEQARAVGQDLESRAAAVLDGTSQEMARRAEERLAASREQARAAGQDLESRAAALLETASQEMTRRADERVAASGEQARAAGQDLESRAAAILETASQEMTRRAEAAMQAWGERVRSIQEAAGQEIDRFGIQLKNDLSSRLEGTNEILKNIEATTAAAQESLRSTQESLASVSDRALEAVTGRMESLIQDLMGNSERQMEESGRAATAKWIAELEDKATDATYTAFGSLFKVSEWCEKKATMRMQAALEKGLDTASDNVREKAEAALREFSAQAEAATGRISEFIEAERAQIRTSWETEGQEITSRLRAAFTEDTQATFNRASQDLLNQVSSVLETVRAETQAHENRLRDVVSQLGEQAIQAHEMRLDQVSRSSLQETISKFSQESSQHLDTLVISAEQRLRHTCNEVFTEVGEALRQRLLELTFPRPQAKAATDSA